ncbi:MAG: Smr/MutS family protein [Hyphomicrobiales bacterium]|nr:Smr/MutS family protein [Hyphomicrobiales bacterium]
MTGDGTRRGRPLHPDEGELFRRAMGDVRPLKGEAGRPRHKKAERPPKAVDGTKGVPRPSAAAPHKAAPPLEHGKAPGLDKRTALRMKRGKVVIDARIDLHGLTQDEAHRALNAFLAAAQDADRRCVLVITGKGSVRDGGGVLRTNVPRWLNEPANRSRVNAFSHASPRDGGEGALYVMVKRRK